VGDNGTTWVTNLVDNQLSIKLCPLTVTPLTLRVFQRNASYWIVRVLSLADFGCRWRNQLWWVNDPRPDLENLCGHDTGGVLGAAR
jgi:hypothetical protein